MKYKETKTESFVARFVMVFLVEKRSLVQSAENQFYQDYIEKPVAEAVQINIGRALNTKLIAQEIR